MKLVTLDRQGYPTEKLKYKLVSINWSSDILKRFDDKTYIPDVRQEKTYITVILESERINEFQIDVSGFLGVEYESIDGERKYLYGRDLFDLGTFNTNFWTTFWKKEGFLSKGELYFGKKLVFYFVYNKNIIALWIENYKSFRVLDDYTVRIQFLSSDFKKEGIKDIFNFNFLHSQIDKDSWKHFNNVQLVKFFNKDETLSILENVFALKKSNFKEIKPPLTEDRKQFEENPIEYGLKKFSRDIGLDERDYGSWKWYAILGGSAILLILLLRR